MIIFLKLFEYLFIIFLNCGWSRHLIWLILPSLHHWFCVYPIASWKQTMDPNTTPCWNHQVHRAHCCIVLGSRKWWLHNRGWLRLQSGSKNNDFTDSLEAQSYKREMPLETQAQWDQRNTLHGSNPTNHQIEANSSLQTQAGRHFFFPPA